MLASERVRVRNRDIVCVTERETDEGRETMQLLQT